MSPKEQHHEISPSSFPMREHCTHFTSDPKGDSEAAKEGTRQHKYIELLIKRDMLNEDISDDEISGVANTITSDGLENAMWGFEEIKRIAIKACEGHSINDISIHAEHKTAIMSSDFDMSEGTIDVSITTPEQLIVIDYKSGRFRDFSGQLKSYGLGEMQLNERQSVKVYTVYGAMNKAFPYLYTRDEAQEYFDGMVKDYHGKDEFEKTPNDYCDWCEHHASCPARSQEVAKIVGSSVDFTINADLANTNTADLELGYNTLLHIAKFADEVKKELKLRLEREGDGSVFKLGKGKPRSSFDLQAFMESSGADAYDLIGSCSITMSNIKEYIYGADKNKNASKKDFVEKYSKHVETKVSAPAIEKITAKKK